MERFLSANMIDFSLTDGTRVGIFCVWKSDKQKMRVIVDARLSNCAFCEPENPDLPTGGSFSRVHIDQGEALWVSSVDLKDAFYTMELPFPL
eukprot:3955516-Karenia_brevis.AAC.1